jgi:hypothetical protein
VQAKPGGTTSSPRPGNLASSDGDFCFQEQEMPDFYLDFMTPDIWDGLVIGVILVGVALAILRLYADRARYLAKQKKRPARDDNQTSEQTDHHH